MDKEDLKTLNRARVTAGWSYLGALIPIVGLILGIISLSNLGSIEDTDSPKISRRIKSVKKLAVGGIMLSVIIGVLYGVATAYTVQHNSNAQLQMVQAKASDEERSCEQQIIAINNKANDLNQRYTTAKNGPAPYLGEFATNPDKCKSGTASAVSTATTSYQSDVMATKARCLEVANETYNHNLQINAVSQTTDSNGQILYRLTQADTIRIPKLYEQDKDACNVAFAYS